MRIVDCFKNEYNAPISVEVQNSERHRQVEIAIRSARSAASWEITEWEAWHLLDALEQVLKASRYGRPK